MAKAETKFESSERRADRRYGVIDGAFLVVNADTNEILGEMLDISHTGLAFRYDQNQGEPGEADEITIVSSSDDVRISTIPYLNINDFEEGNGFPFNSFKRRRRGVRFVRLSSKLKLQIDQFIESEIKRGEY